MRSLTSEEIELVERQMRRLFWVLVLCFVILPVWLLFGGAQDLVHHGGLALLLLFIGFCSVVLGFFFWKMRQMQADLHGGFVDTVAGEIEHRGTKSGVKMRRYNTYEVRIRGQGYEIPRELSDELEVSDLVTLDFLPRSRFVVKLEEIEEALQDEEDEEIAEDGEGEEDEEVGPERLA